MLRNYKATASNVSNSASLPINATGVPASTLHLRKRHRKRNSNWYDYYNFNENTTALEWSNPCGGFYIPTPGQRQRRKNQKQIYNLLKKAAGNEFRTLNNSQEDIDINNIKIWFLHDYNYKFLPKLKINSTIALKRWYRNMQTYVASFAYLRRVQLKWDRRHPKRESRTARELKHLLLSSRSMLCELETAVNHTYPVRSINNNRSNNNNNNNNDDNNDNANRSKGEVTFGSGATALHRRQLQQITRTQMNKRLKLRTKRRNSANNAALAASAVATNGDDNAGSDAELYDDGADSIDLKFVKFYYYEFLKTMWKLLRLHTKRQGQQQLQQRQQRQQHRHARQQQQQQQRVQQIMLAQRLHAQSNRKEYNEVDKPSSNSGGGGGAARITSAKNLRKHGKRSNRSRAQQRRMNMAAAAQ